MNRTRRESALGILSWMLLFSTALIFAALVSTALVSSAQAQTSTTTAVSQSAGAGGAQPFDVKAAVDAYLARVPADQRARSDAYFEGGYWLLLWDFLAGALVMWILLRFRWSVGMRDQAERLTRFKVLQAAIYWVQFVIVVSVLMFPLTIYESFFREHKYGLSNQTFGQWTRDQAVGMAVAAVLGAILLAILFAVVRRLGKNWWVWASAVCLAFLAFVALIAPVFIFPLFNTFTKLEDARIKDPILSLARANGIPATDVYVFDASRQSNRVSANVSGFAGTTRISLNDNLLKRCTLPGIEATMGHEMGHYVLNHKFKGLVLNGVVLVLMFAFLNWGLNAALARWGEAWGIRGITDFAVLPLAIVLVSVFSFVFTPVDNTITRTMEYEADMYGINASQQPDGEAEVDLMLGEYRKLDPGPIEEFIFFRPSRRADANYGGDAMEGGAFAGRALRANAFSAALMTSAFWTVASFALSGLAGLSLPNPGLAPGATFFRRSAAVRSQVQPFDCNEFTKICDGGFAPKLASVADFGGFPQGFGRLRAKDLAQRKSFPLRGNSYSITNDLLSAFSAT